MTPSERSLRQRILRQVAAREREIRDDILRMFDALRDLVTGAELKRLIEQSGLGAADLLTDEALEDAVAKLRFDLQVTLSQGASSTARHIAGLNPSTVFNVLNPNVIQAARALDTRVIEKLKLSTVNTFKEEIVAGLEEGVNPRTIARRVRDSIGLAPNQAQAVRNFRTMLEEGNSEVLTRTLRDRRFDSTIKKAFAGDGLSAKQIDTMVTSYERRMIAFNAEVNARTATLDALRAGQRLAWDRATELGVVDRSRLMKRRSVRADGRQRPEHDALRNQVRHIDSPYDNGEIVSGQFSFNCRCIDVYFQEAAVPFGPLEVGV